VTVRDYKNVDLGHIERENLNVTIAASGSLTAEGKVDRYVVIDGYKRIAAREQLGRDTVEAVVWPMSEAARRG